MVRVSGRAKEMKRICWLIVAALLTACSPAP
ncbi:MAG: TlpA family protein disulfide reductase, partial [Aeromonas salmonicida]